MLKKYIKHPLEFLVVLFFYVLFWALPFRVASHFCAFITEKVGMRLSLSKRVDKNIQQVFPQKTGEERREIIRGVWKNLGRLVGEFSHVYKIKFPDDPRICIEGLEHVEPFLNQQKPVVFITAHFGNWEILGGFIASLFPGLQSVYRTANNPFADWLICFARRNKNQVMVPKGAAGMRQLVKGVKNGKSVAMLIDQKITTGITLPFLGRKAKTLVAHAALAHRFDTVIIPARNVRLHNDPDGALFRIIFEAPIIPVQTGDKDADIRDTVVKTNAVMERWIRKDPAQWFWLHNRWKK
ncbi:MAG: lysophospholipid acyltransferase family protein [Alphaproteobacteria bacterium]